MPYKKILYITLAVGLLAAAMLALFRWQTETSANRVEIAYDFRDLLDVAALQPNREDYLERQLLTLQQAGVQSLTVYESTLEELAKMERIRLYSAKEQALLENRADFQPGYTYVLFNGHESQLSAQLQSGFARIQVSVEPWEWNGQAGVRIALPYEHAILIPLHPDLVTMEFLRERGFQLIARMGNRVAYDATYMQEMLSKLALNNVTRIIFEGEAVPGYSEIPAETSANLNDFANRLQHFGIGIAVIELQKEEQKGVQTLARNIDYNVVRLHSITERDALLKPAVLADRMALAVKDRNIRILFLNGTMIYEKEKNTLTNAFQSGNLITALKGDDGAIASIRAAGYEVGPAQAFAEERAPLQGVLQILAMLGCYALLLLLALQFSHTLARVAGLILVLLITVTFHSLAVKILALGAAVSAPSLAVIYAVRYLRPKDVNVAQLHRPKLGGSLARAVFIFSLACLGSLTGALLTVGLLHDVSYLVVLDQFRGVSVLHLAPMLVVAVYVLFFLKDESVHQRLESMRAFLAQPVYVLWMLLAAVVGAGLLYYLTRTGNSGETLQIEAVFRGFLENTLGIRPRTKEFLFAHPLFIFAAYLMVRYQKGALLFALAVMGQLSIVSSFTHLHTPLEISLLRVIYGMGAGIAVALLLIFAWHLALKGWQSWLRSSEK